MRISKSTIISSLALVAILIGIPLALITYEAQRTGQSVGEYIKRSISKMGSKSSEDPKGSSNKPKAGEKIQFLKKTIIGDPAGDSKPWITHLAIVDLDQDGLKDVVVCDAKRNQISWIRQDPLGTYSEKKIGSQVRAPVHVTPFDIDKERGHGSLDCKNGDDISQQ